MAANTILIDLHMLLDTRLGALTWISDDLGYELAQDSSYYTRQSDELVCRGRGKLSKKTLDNILNDPVTGQEVLKNSVMTAFTGFLLELLMLQKEIALGSPIDEMSSIDINTYPYTLKSEVSRELASAITHHLHPLEMDVRVVRIEPQDLTGDMVSARYMAFALYDPTQWIEANKDAFIQMAYRTLTLYTPRINHVRNLTEQEKTELGKMGDRDLFELLQEVLKAHVRVQYLDVAVVCANTPINPKHTFRSSIPPIV